jgi:ABC-type Fe3+-hydroxamate transport system substrate-binding protein
LLTDDLGHPVPVRAPVRRVVSLVPSLTEAIASLDRGLVVGATTWCTHPVDLDVVRVRGTKNPDVRAIAALRPDVVVANKEENRLRDVERLRGAGIPVWVTEVTSVKDGLRALRRLFTELLVRDEPRWLDDAARAWSSPPAGVARSAVIVVWRDPWMVVGRDTFAGDMLGLLGVRNLFASASGRYPHTTVEEIRQRRPDVVVLPNEPYPFSAADGPEQFPGLPTALVDGRHLTWYGPSLAAAPGILRTALQILCKPAGGSGRV